ncbi:hypothetical protein LLW22_16905 [Enterococcus casseliflavus]|nr:hypothetical protein LLW22_16905 [Enterococcus casseliflavus]
MKSYRWRINLIIIYFFMIMGLSGCSDSNQEFYGRWSGEDDLGVLYDYDITKDYIAEYVSGVMVSKMKYKVEQLGVKKTLQIPDDELKKRLPELKNSEYNSAIVFSLSDDEEAIDLFIALDGVAGSGKLYKKSQTSEYNSISESTIESKIVENSVTSSESFTKSTEASFSDQLSAGIDSNLDEKIDSFIANYTSIPPDWIMEKELDGITIRTTDFTAHNETEASTMLSNLQGISNTVKTLVGNDVPLRLLEQDNHDYSVTFINGEVVSANDVYESVTNK